MEASFFTSYNLPQLSDVRIWDNSIYNGLSPYDINATRILFATVNTLNNINTDVVELIAYKQYIVTSGSTIINGHTYTIGDKIYLANDTTPSGTFKISETGYYGIRSTYLPVNPYVSYTPSQMIYNDNVLYFNDNVITCIYELYSTKYAEGLVEISSETQFIVTGDQEGSILIGAERYYVGEVFTKSADFSFSDESGVNYVVSFEASTEKNFRTWYQNWTLWGQYFNKISTSYQVSQSFLADFMAVTARINQCALYENQNFNTSTQSVQDLMDDVNTNYQLK